MVGIDGVLSPAEWLALNCPEGMVIGFDPTLMSHATFLKYSKVLALVDVYLYDAVGVCFFKALQNGQGAVLHSVDENLVDIVWSKLRPPLPNSDLRILIEEYSGK